MQKKYVAVLLTLTLMVGFFCAFPSQAISAKKVVKWNMNFWGGSRGWTKPAEQWAKDMERYTNGRWQIKIHFGGVLSPPKEVLDGIKAGMFEATGFCTAYTPAKTPLHRVMDLPFISATETVHNQKLMKKLWEHPALKKELLKWNAVPLLPAGLPTYHLMGNKAIRTVADLKGARIRIGGDQAKVLKQFGAVTMIVPAPEVYESIARGTIDLVGLPYTYALGSYRIHEVSKYLNIPMTLGTMVCPIVANKDAWDALPEEFKKIHQVYYDLAPVVWADEYNIADAKWLPIFKKKLEFIDFPASERAKLVGKAEDIYKKWVAEMEKKGLPGQDVFDYFLKIRKEIVGY